MVIEAGERCVSWELHSAIVTLPDGKDLLTASLAEMPQAPCIRAGTEKFQTSKAEPQYLTLSISLWVFSWPVPSVKYAHNNTSVFYHCM